MSDRGAIQNLIEKVKEKFKSGYDEDKEEKVFSYTNYYDKSSEFSRHRVFVTIGKNKGGGIFSKILNMRKWYVYYSVTLYGKEISDFCMPKNVDESERKYFKNYQSALNFFKSLKKEVEESE